MNHVCFFLLKAFQAHVLSMHERMLIPPENQYYRWIGNSLFHPLLWRLLFNIYTPNDCLCLCTLNQTICAPACVALLTYSSMWSPDHMVWVDTGFQMENLRCIQRSQNLSACITHDRRTDILDGCSNVSETRKSSCFLWCNECLGWSVSRLQW